MILRVTKEGNVAVPSDLLVAIGVQPGDQIDVEQGPESLILRPVKADSEVGTSHSGKVDLSLLGYLRDKIKPGTPPFDIEKFRNEPYDLSLRD